MDDWTSVHLEGNSGWEDTSAAMDMTVTTEMLQRALGNIKGRSSAPGTDMVTYAMFDSMPEDVAQKLSATMESRAKGSPRDDNDT